MAAEYQLGSASTRRRGWIDRNSTTRLKTPPSRAVVTRRLGGRRPTGNTCCLVTMIVNSVLTAGGREGFRPGETIASLLPGYPCVDFARHALRNPAPQRARNKPAKRVPRSAGFAIRSPRDMGDPHDIAPRGS
jgi:hypothetical protein